MRRPSTINLKRWTLKVPLCLLAGAVVTWGVAWGCALWGERPSYDSERYLKPNTWPRGAPARWPAPESEAVRENLSRTEHTTLHLGPPPHIRKSGKVAEVYEFGWPSRGMSFTHIYEGAVIERTAFDRIPEWLPRSDDFDGLPTGILPLGFAFDTLFYGGVVLGVVEGVGFARRQHRRSRGRCAACGYDRRGIAAGEKCPECGAGAE